jgi:hypothetical protein
MVVKVTDETLEQIADLTTPHMDAADDAITKAFPDSWNEMCLVAAAFRFCVALDVIDRDDRFKVIKMLNELLAAYKLNYAFVSVS